MTTDKSKNVKYIIPHNRPEYKSCNMRKKYYNNNNHLVIVIGHREYIYPPKAGVILFDVTKSKILIVKNKNTEGTGKWGLPKGHVEENESREDCAMRELHEETGINLYIVRDEPRIRINNSIYYVYYIKDTNIKVIPNDKNEIHSAKFCFINRIKTLDINRELAVAITNKIIKITKIAKLANIIGE